MVTTINLRKFVSDHIEMILALGIFIVFFVFFSLYAAGPAGSDELLYADIGLRGYGNYIVMNRYTHIYLQAIFMKLAPTPLIGMKLFSGFVMSASAAVVFLLGRFLRKENNIWHGVIALVLLLSTNLFNRYFGIPIVDTTTMLMVLIFVLVFVYYSRKKRANWVIIFLGLIFFLGFKTKEFAVILLLVLPSFGFDKNQVFDWKELAKGLLLFLLGIIIGVILYIVLNSIFLKDPLFSFRWSDILNFRATISSFTKIKPDPESYLQALVWPLFFLSFILYLMSFVKRQKSLSISDKIVWIMPLAYLVMLNLLMIRSGWRTDERYLYPVLGLITAIAPQFFEFKMPSTKENKLVYILLLIAGVVIIFLVRWFLIWASNYLGITLSEIVLHYAIDLFFVLLLIAMLMLDEKSSTISILFIVLIGLNVYFSLSMNLKAVLRRDNPNRVNNRFAALVVPDDLLNLCPSSTVGVSSGLLRDMEIHPDPYEAAAILNIFYDARLPIDAFTFPGENEALDTWINQSDSDYLFISGDEWDGLTAGQFDFEIPHYHVLEGTNRLLVILENNNNDACKALP